MKILATFAVIAVTTGRDMAGDEPGPIRKVLTLEKLQPIEALLTLFRTEKDRESFRAKYWNTDGNLVVSALSDEVTLEVEIKGGKASVQASGGFGQPMNFEGIDLKKIRLKPEAGNQVMTKLALHLHPSEEQCGRLDHMLQTEVTIVAERAQAELELEPPAAEDETRDAGADETGSVVPGQPAPQRPKRSSQPRMDLN